MPFFRQSPRNVGSNKNTGIGPIGATCKSKVIYLVDAKASTCLGVWESELRQAVEETFEVNLPSQAFRLDVFGPTSFFVCYLYVLTLNRQFLPPNSLLGCSLDWFGSPKTAWDHEESLKCHLRSNDNETIRPGSQFSKSQAVPSSHSKAVLLPFTFVAPMKVSAPNWPWGRTRLDRK